MLDDWFKSRKTNLVSPMGRAVSTASVIGLHMVVAVFIGFAIGYFLDDFLGTRPWLTIIFLAAGIVAGFKNLIVQGKKLIYFQDKMDEERRAAEFTVCSDMSSSKKKNGNQQTDSKNQYNRNGNDKNSTPLPGRN